MSDNSTVGRFHIPGEATRREYAVYVMVARHKTTGEMHVYVGKTGDNKDGCNPVISRAGNHFSFNRVHSQMRNHLPSHPHDFDFDFFYATFGAYVDPKESRMGIDVINEMERRLNFLIQAEHKEILLNPFAAKTKLRKWQHEARATLRTEPRENTLVELVKRVTKHIASHHSSAPVVIGEEPLE